jgi:D-alanyl-D-alanine carboxypeptidase
MMRLLDSTFASINQNPQLVARANVPWQTLASNTPSTPVIAGFQIAAGLSAPATQPGQTATDLPVRANIPAMAADDEDAAESRPDPELDAQTPALSPSVKAAPVVASIPPPPAPTPPANTRVAMASLPILTLRPSVTTSQPHAPAFVPHVVPSPKPRMVLAAFQTQQVPAPITPKPRAILLPKKTVEPTLSAAVAQTAAMRDWSIQIGAFADPTLAKAQLAAYAERSMDVLGQADRQVIPFQSAEGKTVFRARFGPFPEREAREVCQRLTERGQTCFAALAQR